VTAQRSAPVDGFSLAYDRPSPGAGPAVVLLHGWPGTRTDHRALVPLLTGAFDVVVPDLRGFGGADRHEAPPAEQYSAVAQARSVAALIEELGLAPAVLAGYDVGGRVCQAVAREHPALVRGLAIAPPFPGAGQRILNPDSMREFWYQGFHQLPLATELVDGDRTAVRAYLRHFWEHWSGPGHTVTEADLDALADDYAPPGAFAASIAWYRAGAGMVATSLAERAPAPEERIACPVVALWPEHDHLFPPAWADRLGEFFADVELVHVADAGHFVSLEAPETFADAIRAVAAR